MIHHLVHLGISPWEKAIRTAAVYLALLALLHLAGKRELAQLNSLDLVVLLLLSNVVQNAVIGNDNSLLGGLLGAVVLIGRERGARAGRPSCRLASARWSRERPRSCRRTARSTSARCAGSP